MAPLVSDMHEGVIEYEERMVEMKAKCMGCGCKENEAMFIMARE